MGKHSKQKGANFEREVCKDLSLWMTYGLRDDTLWRSTMSGGRATIKKRKGELAPAQDGDISAIDSVAENLTKTYFIELKNYVSLRWDLLLLKRSGRLVEFWNETTKAAEESDKLPLLIAKQNRTPIKIITDAQGWLRTFYPQPQEFLEAYFPPTENTQEMIIADYVNFLQNANPDVLREDFSLNVNQLGDVIGRTIK